MGSWFTRAAVTKQSDRRISLLELRITQRYLDLLLAAIDLTGACYGNEGYLLCLSPHSGSSLTRRES
jgi:hypothetical protein